MIEFTLWTHKDITWCNLIAKFIAFKSIHWPKRPILLTSTTNDTISFIVLKQYARFVWYFIFLNPILKKIKLLLNFYQGFQPHFTLFYGQWHILMLHNKNHSSLLCRWLSLFLIIYEVTYLFIALSIISFILKDFLMLRKHIDYFMFVCKVTNIVIQLTYALESLHFSKIYNINVL